MKEATKLSLILGSVQTVVQTPFVVFSFKPITIFLAVIFIAIGFGSPLLVSAIFRHEKSV